MGAIKDVVDLTEKLANSVKDRKFAGDLLAIQRAIAALQTEHASIQEKDIELMGKNAELQQEVHRLQQKIQELQKPAQPKEDFVEQNGLLFKRKPDGSFHHAAYCPRCKMPMGSKFPEFTLQCPPCNTMGNINGRQLDNLIIEMNKNLKS